MNENATTKSCSQCGNIIPPDAPQGLCPVCVLGGVVTTTVASQPADHPELPRLEVVRAAFPQLEVLELIGQGGMGFVYKARQLNLDRLVALKLLWPKLGTDPAFAERFSREARVLARLNHPNIVAVHDFGQSGGFFYLVIEFVDGVNLRQAMQAGRFSPQQALSLVPKICEALQFAHDEGILHRDIKPENILLDAKGRVKIADFGIAKLVGEPRPVTKLTATGAAVGTPNYMAPEQLEHPEDVDQRADVYSVGVVFYEMLTGELPMGRFAPPSKKTTIDERVDEIVLKALARERELRQQSAGEVKTQVENLKNPAPTERTARPAPAAGLAESATQGVRAAGGSADEGWSRPAIWGAALTGLSLPLPLFILVAGMLGMAGLGPGELWITIGCIALLGIPGTLLGWIALSQIRRSQGQLQGLLLALFAALMWPLLVSFLATALPPLLIITPKPAPWGPALLLLPIGALFLGVWAVRAAARWGSGGAKNLNASHTGQIPVPPSETAAPAATTMRWSKKAIAALVVSGAGLFPPLLMIAIGFYLALPFDHSFVASNLRTQFLFGTIVALAPAITGTLLGFSALREIRRAAGQLRGRRLALWATLFWPLLLLDVLVVCLAAGTGGRFAVQMGGGMGALLLILPLVLLAVLALNFLVSAKVWRWATYGDALTPSQRKSPVLVSIALCSGIGLMIPALALAFSVWMPKLAKASRDPNMPRQVAEWAPVTEAAVEITTPPRQRFTASWTMFSNNIPVLGPVLVADLPAPNLEPGQFTAQWRLLETTGPEADGAPWELTVLGAGTNRIVSRPPLGKLPSLEWLISASERNVRLQSNIEQTRDTEIFHAEHSPEGASSNLRTRWSVRLTLRSSIKPQLGTGTNRMDAVASPGAPEAQ